MRQKIHHLEQQLATRVYYVALFIGKVTLGVNASTEVINEIPVCVLLNDDVVSLIPFKNSNGVLDVKTLPAVSKQLRQFTITHELPLIKPLSALFVNNVTHRSHAEPSLFVYSASSFIYGKTLTCLK